MTRLFTVALKCLWNEIFVSVFIAKSYSSLFGGYHGRIYFWKKHNAKYTFYSLKMLTWGVNMSHDWNEFVVVMMYELQIHLIIDVTVVVNSFSVTGHICTSCTSMFRKAKKTYLTLCFSKINYTVSMITFKQITLRFCNKNTYENLVL